MKKRFLSSTLAMLFGTTVFGTTVVAFPAFAQMPAAPTPDAPQNFISNGNFELDADTDAQPDGWGTTKGGMSWETEGANHFYRLKAPAPGKMTMIYRLISIPDGVRAVELTWKQRIGELKPGKQAWFDARIMMEWKDAAGEK